MKTREQDKRVTKVMVFDTETAPYYHDDKCDQVVFDLGYTIADKKGNIFIKRNFLVKEVFTNMSIMQKAYYFSKYPLYLEMIQDGKVKMTPWREIVFQMQCDIEDYNIKEAYAYNIAFDLEAIKTTHRMLTNRSFYLWKMLEIKTNCLWGMSCETILQQKGFKELATEQKWFTPSGNLSTNAEVTYRYITQSYEFEESHTALDDAIIETAIMAKCYKTHKKMSFGIIHQPWKLVNNKENAE